MTTTIPIPSNIPADLRAKLGKLTALRVEAGCALVPSARGIKVYRTALDGSACDCEARGMCWHRRAVQAIEMAQASPAGCALPTVQESIDRANRALGLETMPRFERAVVALALVNELF